MLKNLELEFRENKAEMCWYFPNGSQIWFQELDKSKDQDWDKIKGIEATAFGIDEANEVSEEAFNILMGRIWRCNPNGEHSFSILTCNPANNWVKHRFYTPSVENQLQEKFYFLQALAHDNPFLPAEYLETLELLPEAEYERFVNGNWDFADDPNQLVKYEWIKNNLWTPVGEVESMGIDVAREGDDRTVFAYSAVEGLLNYETFKHQDTMTSSQIAIERMKEKGIGAKNTGVDVVGVGGGVVDAMRSDGYRVRDFNSGSSPTKQAGHLMFKNLRAEVFWDLREALQSGEYKLPNDKKLIQELLSIHYQVTDKVIQMESKANMKKRMGHSPDIVDAVVIAKYCLKDKPRLVIGAF